MAKGLRLAGPQNRKAKVHSLENKAWWSGYGTGTPLLQTSKRGWGRQKKWYAFKAFGHHSCEKGSGAEDFVSSWGAA